MRFSIKKFFVSFLSIAILLVCSQLPAYGQSEGDQTTAATEKTSPSPPGLNDIIPLASELSVRLSNLKKRLGDEQDVSAIEANYAATKVNLQSAADQLQVLRESTQYKYNKLVALRESIKNTDKEFDEIREPISRTVGKFEAMRKEWLTEKKRWSEWESSLHQEGTFDQLKSTFVKANDTIDTALDLVLSHLKALLTAEETAGNIQAQIDDLTNEINDLIQDERRSTLFSESPPMFSFQYFSQLQSSRLWQAVKQSPAEIVWPDSRFVDQLGWVILLQGFVFFFVVIVILRNRQALNESERWQFAARRPAAAGLFIGYMMTVLMYEYGFAPPIWELANMTVAAISFARLIGAMLEVLWKRQIVYGLFVVLIVNTLMETLSFPIPLFRLYVFFTALAALLFCLRLAKISIRHKEPWLYPVLLRLGSLVFASIMIADLFGKILFSSFLFVSMIDSIATILVFILFMYIINGGLEWLFRAPILQRAAVFGSEDDIDAIIRQVTRLIDVLICGLVLLPALLMIWGVYSSLADATSVLLAVGFNLGALRISVGLLLTSAAILYVSFFLSWVLQKLIMNEVFLKSKIEKGARYSIGKLFHYAIVVIGFLVALSALGFEVTKITIILSALGVGIGFGLQAIVNNFVSGLILLFERPVRVGDIIELGGNWATIKRIGLRATTVQTYDQADVIIPNGDLVTNQVTNWTLSNRQARLIIRVGVAYGSDVTLVIETLLASAKENPGVVKMRPPQVLFLNFGDSSLDFELRVWVLDADDRLIVSSSLHQEIDRQFREAGIEIAFPQRDLHLRSIDESVSLSQADTKA